MADPNGFLKHDRKDAPKRPKPDRLADWREVYADQDAGRAGQAGPRPGDPVHGLRDPVLPLGFRRLSAREPDPGVERPGAASATGPSASNRLHATNNFPEFTGKLCPAPCESACVLSITPDVRRGGRDQARRGGHRRRVVGEGPDPPAAGDRVVRQAGRGRRLRPGRARGGAAADPRRPRGDRVRAGRPARRPAAVRHPRVQDGEEGPRPAAGAAARGGHPVRDRLRGRRLEPGDLSVETLRAHRSTRWCWRSARCAAATRRTSRAASLYGVHLAMEHLVPANKECEGDGPTSISAAGKHVIIIGGGDTGADCYGTATRQGALSVTQLDQYPQPPTARDDERSPWPVWPWILRTYPAHEEAGERRFAVAVEEFVGRRRRQRAARCGCARSGSAGTRRPASARSPRSTTTSRRSRRTWCCWRSASRAWSTCRCSTAWACH